MKKSFVGLVVAFSVFIIGMGLASDKNPADYTGRSATEVTCAPRTETKSAGQQRALAGLLALWRQPRSLKEVVTALRARDHSGLRLTIRAVASSVSMPGDANAWAAAITLPSARSFAANDCFSRSIPNSSPCGLEASIIPSE